MTYRTTGLAVSKIRSVDEDGDLDTILDPFIETANSLVTEKCTSGSLPDARLELIERWLSAHFYSLYNEARLTLSETVGPITETFFGKVGYALNLTPYGQMALILDTTGQLAIWNQQVINGQTQVPTITWGGTERESY